MTLHSHQRPKLQTPHASAQADEAPGAEPGDVVVVVRLQESLCEFSGRSEWSEDPSCEPRIWAFAAAASRCPQPLISTSPDSNTSKTTIIIHIILHILLHHGHFKS